MVTDGHRIRLLSMLDDLDLDISSKNKKMIEET